MASPTEFMHAPHYLASTDRSLLSVESVHEHLNRTYWAKGAPLATVATAIDHSVCLGVYDTSVAAAPVHKLVGFGRWVTDRSTFATCLWTVRVPGSSSPSARLLTAGSFRGLGKFLVASLVALPEIEDVERRSCWRATPRGCMSAMAGSESVTRTDIR